MTGLRRNRSERGVAMVEAGLVLPIVFMLFFGFIQFALILGAFNSAAYGCRQATRYAIVHGSTAPAPCTAAQLQNIVKANSLMAAAATVSVPSPVWTPDNTPGSSVTVSATLTFNLAVPFVKIHLFTVTTSSTMDIVQ